MAETPTGEARNAAIAITTCLINGEDEEAWRIARSGGLDAATVIVLLARVLAGSHTAETWRQTTLNIASGR